MILPRTFNSTALTVVELGSVAEVRLSRAQDANSINSEILKGLELVLRSINKLKIAHVLLTADYSGQRTPVFCGGGDLRHYHTLKTKIQGVQFNRKMTQILNSFEKSKSIFTAVVDGKCIGGGCELVLACDRILATPRAQFQFGQVKVGLSPGWGGAQKLLQRVRKSVALEWISTGRVVSAEEALRQGLIDEIIPGHDTLEEAQGILSQWSESGELLTSLKQVVHSPKNEQKIFEKLWWSKGHLEKLKAFVGSRKR